MASFYFDWFVHRKFLHLNYLNLLLFCAGVFTGITACIIDIGIELLSSYKYNFLKKCILFIQYLRIL